MEESELNYCKQEIKTDLTFFKKDLLFKKTTLSEKDGIELVFSFIALHGSISFYTYTHSYDFEECMKNKDILQFFLEKAGTKVVYLIRNTLFKKFFSQDALVEWLPCNPFLIEAVHEKTIPMIIDALDRDWRTFATLTSLFASHPIVFSRALSSARKDSRRMDPILMQMIPNMDYPVLTAQEQNIFAVVKYRLHSNADFDLLQQQKAQHFDRVGLGYKLILVAAKRSSVFLKKTSLHGDIFRVRLLKLIFEFAENDFFNVHCELEKNWARFFFGMYKQNSLWRPFF